MQARRIAVIAGVTAAAAGLTLWGTSRLLSSGDRALVGIAFGLYPAFKASRLDPIAALRQE